MSDTDEKNYYSKRMKAHSAKSSSGAEDVRKMSN